MAQKLELKAKQANCVASLYENLKGMLCHSVCIKDQKGSRVGRRFINLNLKDIKIKETELKYIILLSNTNSNLFKIILTLS